MAKRAHNWVTWLSGMMLVLSQFMVLAHACDRDFASAAHAVAGVQSAHGMPCQDMGGQSVPDHGHTPSLCLAHCEQAPQHLLSAYPDLPEVAHLIALFEWPNTWKTGSMASLGSSLRDDSRFPVSFHTPPLRLMLQVFRI